MSAEEWPPLHQMWGWGPATQIVEEPVLNGTSHLLDQLLTTPLDDLEPTDRAMIVGCLHAGVALMLSIHQTGSVKQELQRVAGAWAHLTANQSGAIDFIVHTQHDLPR